VFGWFRLFSERSALGNLAVYFRRQNTHHARMKIHELNHVAIHIADVERSSAFYRGVLRLEMLPRPAFDFPGAWFRLGVSQELHLIGRHGPVAPPDGNNHFALRVDDLATWEKHLQQAGAEFRPRKQRPDGAWQIFLRDPDGHLIELFTF
jgi:catechol 2,3-dioxygenase-like lactoylglutathione lyase family enzyme